MDKQRVGRLYILDINMQKKKKPLNSFLKKRKKLKKDQTILYIALLIGVALISVRVISEYMKDNKIPTISDIATGVIAGEITSIAVKGNEVEVVFANEEKKALKKETGTAFDESLLRHGVTTEQLSKIQYEAKNPTGFGYWFGRIFPFLIPLSFLILFIWFFTSQSKGMGGMQIFNFGRSRAQEINPREKNKRISFDDVAGAEEAKQELMEFVEFLKSPQKFIEIGAKVPRGVLLSGAPGTGKTLLARAVAGEARVPFFSVSGSEFVEMFVGVGAARVRDLFKTAKERSPSIVFIDEIDAIGRARGGSFGGGNDEREQSLNQILVEMDGFEQSDKVIVLAASNRPDVLDAALVRTGRFDRKVVVGLPDRKEREMILQVHTRDKKLGSDVDLEVIARRTIGFSGADLAAVVNEGAIRAVRMVRKEIRQEDLREAIEKVMLGPERKTKIPDNHEQKVIAYHEAGHALLGSVMPSADPVEKISVVSRGHIGGYVMNIPNRERNLKTKQEFFETIVTLLGGYVTEKIVFGDVSTGPSNDLDRVAQIAHDMVTQFGMSDSIGPLVLHRLRTNTGGPIRDLHSDETKKAIDKEVAKIVAEAEKIAKKYIKKYRGALDRIVEELFKQETLERSVFEKILEEEYVEIQNDSTNTTK